MHTTGAKEVNSRDDQLSIGYLCEEFIRPRIAAKSSMRAGVRTVCACGGEDTHAAQKRDSSRCIRQEPRKSILAMIS